MIILQMYIILEVPVWEFKYQEVKKVFCCNRLLCSFIIVSVCTASTESMSKLSIYSKESVDGRELSSCSYNLIE